MRDMMEISIKEGSQMAERGKGFPRLTLSSAIKVIDGAAKFGKTWPKEQFAGFGSQTGAGSARSGAFANRISSLRDYGLITTDKDNVSLTELGIKISKYVTENEREEGIKEAFLNVVVFKTLFEKLEIGKELSVDQLAQAAVFTAGVSRESKDKFINVFIESGKFVKLVRLNKASNTVLLEAISGNPMDDNQVEDEGDSASRDENNTGSQLPAQYSGVITPVNITEMKKPDGAPMAEQGVNFAGSNWALSVILKTNLRLDSDTRRLVRDLLTSADDLADKLHTIEENGSVS
jgi:hypothetical protein